MRIPYAFRIGSAQYEVLQQRELKYSNRGHVFYPPPMGTVHLATHRMGVPLTQRARVRTFWHEVVHAVLHDMRHTLRDDEKFVEGFAKRLTQIVYSAKVR